MKHFDIFPNTHITFSLGRVKVFVSGVDRSKRIYNKDR